MSTLPKPHRVAFLVPDVTVEGPDGVFEREAAVLLWTACIELCQRHPRLAVLDAEATPLLPQDGHFAPQHAGQGGRATDPFFGPTRRDELLWLELSLGARPGVVRLHAVGRDGRRESFDALGDRFGEQLQQVFGAWLSARGLGTLPRRFDTVTTDDVLATVRVIAPTLAEQARAWAMPVAAGSVVSAAEGEPELDARDARGDTMRPRLEASAPRPDDDGSIEVATESTLVTALDPAALAAAAEAAAAPTSPLLRALVNRLPGSFKLPALRLLALALRADLTGAILALDPLHPQALLARFERTPAGQRELAALRQVIASAPGWARPYEQLHVEPGVHVPDAPSRLEEIGAAGLAATCRPAHLHVLDTLATRLVSDGRCDEALRLLERGVALHPDDPQAHLALLAAHEHADRPGAWLEQATRSSGIHGCPMDPALPWYPDQIHVDLRAANALLAVGRLDEALALRANRLAHRESSWPSQTQVLERWRQDSRLVAWSYAREGAYRGDEARALEGLGRAAPGDAVDLALFLDALVALGREDEVALAWAQFGEGCGYLGPVARLAAARALMAAGEWRRGLEQLWRVELGAPGRDELAALARCGVMMGGAPIEVLEEALRERAATGAVTLARRLARDAADFVPAAARSGVVEQALGKPSLVEFDPGWLSGFAPASRGRAAVDALFAELGPIRLGPPRSSFDIGDELQRGDLLVNRWLEVVFSEAGEDDHASLVQAAAYLAAQALARYLAATTAPASTLAGALRVVASGALGLVRRHHRALGDRDARAVLAAVEPMLRRCDRWVGTWWLAAVERALCLDERASGDLAGFARETPSVASRLLGPEETAVLSWSIARLHRERPEGWAAKVAAQASRLATHSGGAGAHEWADAIVEQLAARELEPDDAIDQLHVAAYLAQGTSAGPCVHAARVLLDAGRGPDALAALCAGLGAAGAAERDQALASLAGAWKRASLDVPLPFDQVAAGMFDALQSGKPGRAEQLGRWAVACDPGNAEAHRNLGLALAQQGKVADALAHLARATREQGTQILSGVLYQAGKLPEAMAVLDYASRWYVRADQWLTYGGIAYAAMDNPRTVHGYARAYQLDPGAFDATQLNAYAGVLDEVGDYPACERIADHLLRIAGDDLLWKTSGWNHLACAYVGLGRFAEAVELAERAVAQNPLADNAQAFATTLERARARTQHAPPALSPVGRPREPVFSLLAEGDHAAAAASIGDRSWRVRRGALHGARFRLASENQLAVTARARAAAVGVLVDSVGTKDRDALVARTVALTIRDQAHVTCEPVPALGDRMTREAFYREFRARGGVVLDAEASPPPPFVDREVVPGARVARASDYVALLRDLAALAPAEALAQFDLDPASYLEEARAWARALDADPELARAIAAGLAAR